MVLKHINKNCIGTGGALSTVRPSRINVRPLGVVPLDDFLNTPLPATSTFDLLDHCTMVSAAYCTLHLAIAMSSGTERRVVIGVQEQRYPGG